MQNATNKKKFSCFKIVSRAKISTHCFWLSFPSKKKKKEERKREKKQETKRREEKERGTGNQPTNERKKKRKRKVRDALVSRTYVLYGVNDDE